MENNHLSDKDIISYINSLDNISTDTRKRIEQHIYIAKCPVCSEKLEEVKKLNFRMNNQTEVVYAEDDLQLCSWTDMVADFVNRRLVGEEREKFYEHLVECNICREATVHLSAAINDCENKDSQQDVKDFTWEQFKDGVIRMSRAIGFYKKGESGSFFTPAIGAAGSKFRGNTDEEGSGSKSMEIDLPENRGTIKLIYQEQSTRKDRLIIEPFGVVHGKLLIEIYDNTGALLKSVDGSKPVSCIVEKGGYTIRINSRYEVPINLG